MHRVSHGPQDRSFPRVRVLDAAPMRCVPGPSSGPCARPSAKKIDTAAALLCVNNSSLSEPGHGACRCGQVSRGRVCDYLCPTGWSVRPVQDVAVVTPCRRPGLPARQVIHGWRPVPALSCVNPEATSGVSRGLHVLTFEGFSPSIHPIAGRGRSELPALAVQGPRWHRTNGDHAAARVLNQAGLRS
jgi:hypothetical protein